jgi:DNA-directed RNA polymerase subunit RPC12/RpoP
MDEETTTTTSKPAPRKPPPCSQCGRPMQLDRMMPRVLYHPGMKAYVCRRCGEAVTTWRRCRISRHDRRGKWHDGRWRDVFRLANHQCSGAAVSAPRNAATAGEAEQRPNVLQRIDAQQQ